MEGTNPSNANTAIWVSRNLVADLRSALRTKASTIDDIPSDREILDNVVLQMVKIMAPNFVYYVGRRNIDANGYRWFDSEVARRIHEEPLIKDKGRFVDACIIGYLYGGRGIQKFCRSSRIIRPRVIAAQESTQISKTAAAIAAAKDTDSKFLPTTLPLENGESNLSTDLDNG